CIQVVCDIAVNIGIRIAQQEGQSGCGGVVLERHGRLDHRRIPGDLGEDLRQRPDPIARSAGNLDSFGRVRHHGGRAKISAVAEGTEVVVFNASTLVTDAITFAVIGNHEVTFWAFESKDVTSVGYAISQKSLLTS